MINEHYKYTSEEKLVYKCTMESSDMDEFLEACVVYRCAGRDVRVAARRVDQAVADRSAVGKYFVILSGSWADGMPRDVCGDMDVMLHCPAFPVVLLDSATYDTASHIPHLGYVFAEGNPRQPAYLRLSVSDITNLHNDTQRAVVKDETRSVDYLNGQTLFMNATGDEDVPHGPAMTRMDGGTPIDMIRCLPCPSWPPCASDFLHRHRPHGRPSHTLLQRITDAGCHVVPTGHPDSHQRELEWRWSFSVAEKELIHSMDSNMSAAMYVLKVFKNCVWSETSSREKPSGICSYYFKTACLWSNERNPYTTDTPSLTIAINAIEWLVKCYQEHYLPHYFIPSQNLVGHLPLDMCREAADTLEVEKYNLNAHVLRYCVNDSHLSTAFDNIKKQINFSEEADLLDIDIAAAFLAIVREHNKSQEVLAAATASVRPGREVYRKRELESEESSFIHIWPFDIADLLVYSLRWKIPVSDTPEHLLLPVIENFDDLLEKGCVVMFRSLLYRHMASLYHGLAVSFSDSFLQRLADCLAVTFSSQSPETSVASESSQASLCQGQADISSDIREESTEFRMGWRELSLAQPGLTAALPAAHEPRGDLSTERHCLAKAEEYYRRGIPLVCPNGYDDEGFSGTVHLAAFYHYSEQWDKAWDTLDTERVQSRLAMMSVENVLTPASSYIYIPFAALLAALTWRHEVELYQSLVQEGNTRAVVHPGVQALYLQARLALRLGDVARTKSTFARLAAIRKTLEHWPCVDSADSMTELIVCELSKRQR